MYKVLTGVLCLLIIAGCQRETADDDVLSDEGSITEENGETTEGQSEQTEERVNDVDENEQPSVNHEMTAEEVFVNLLEATEKLDTYKSSVDVYKYVKGSDFELGATIDTDFDVEGFSRVTGDIPKLYFEQQIEAYETAYSMEGYYIGDDRYYEYNDIVEMWYSFDTQYFEPDNFFYKTPYDIFKLLQRYVNEGTLGYFTDEIVVIDFEFDPATDVELAYEFTYYEIEKNVPYVGGYNWMLTDEPITVSLMIDIKKNTLIQLFTVYYEVDGEQSEMKTNMTQGFTYDEPVDPIIVPDEVKAEAELNE